MIAILDGGRMITVFPVSPFPCLPLIKLLTGSTCYQFDRVRNDAPGFIIGDY
jgi:hypothetical protein